MKQISIKNLSLLGLALMATSSLIAAIIPDKSNNKRFTNSGTLRAFSATAAGPDRDTPEERISCINEIETIMSCTATGSNTTTGLTPPASDSVVRIGSDYIFTINNTSQTNYNDSIDNNSVELIIG